MSSVQLMTAIAPTGPMGRRVRVYFAPVNRVTESATLFDASQAAIFLPASPPGPWIDLGWIDHFSRKSEAKITAVGTGAPSLAQYQVRQTAGATVSFSFEQWTKLTMALAGGAEHMNVLVPVHGASANGSGGVSGLAQTIVLNGATATSATMLALSTADLTHYAAGSLIAVDGDYTGQTGFVGSGVTAAYVKSPASVNSDPDYIRRVTFNVALVQQVTTQGLQLAQPLIAGSPTAGMKVQPVLGFVDREGGSFIQEWSALFVMSGEQGDAIFFHYPRLQAMPVVDAVDGQEVFCFRTYVPGPNATV
jgi:hypothetical protein